MSCARSASGRGDTLLVSGAPGGVGCAVLHIARGRGVTVVATAGRHHQDCLRSLRATATTYGDGPVGRVRRFAGRLRRGRRPGRAGRHPGPVEPTDPRKVLSITDSSANAHGAKIPGEPGDPRAALTEAVRLFSAGQLNIPVQGTFPLERAVNAHTRSAEGHVRDRLILAAR